MCVVGVYDCGRARAQRIHAAGYWGLELCCDMCKRAAKGTAEVAVEWGRGHPARVRIDDMALSRVAVVLLGTAGICYRGVW